MQYNNSQLAYRTLFEWRLQLRAHAKQSRQARRAEKFFVTRDAWRKWVEKVNEKRRESKVKEFEARVVGRYLREWHQRAQLERQRKLSEEIIRKRVELVRIEAHARVRYNSERAIADPFEGTKPLDKQSRGYQVPRVRDTTALQNCCYHVCLLM